MVRGEDGNNIPQNGYEYTVDLKTGTKRAEGDFYGFSPSGIYTLLNDSPDDYPGMVIVGDQQWSALIPAYPHWVSQSVATGEIWVYTKRYIYKAGPPASEMERVVKHTESTQASMGADGKLIVFDSSVLDLQTGLKQRLPKKENSHDSVIPGSSSVMVKPYDGDKLTILRVSDMEQVREIPLDPPIDMFCSTDQLSPGCSSMPCAWHEPSNLFAYNDRIKGIRLVDTRTGQTLGYLDTGVDYVALRQERIAREAEEDRKWREQQKIRQEQLDAYREQQEAWDNRPVHTVDVMLTLKGGSCAIFSAKVPREMSPQEALNTLGAKVRKDYWNLLLDQLIPISPGQGLDCEVWKDYDLR